ncbi:GNAT family protein [Kitasatospora sp. NPDC085879]|uniref:GNAT family N-acetyltransferase n=1 Tax=Kitasatospora sp. NPDC085879 TaxID=3154769 RepID=UPI00341A4011
MIELSAAIRPDVLLRPVRQEDSRALCRAYLRNRDHLRPWEPRRGADFFTDAGQAARLRAQLEQREAGRLVPWVLDRDGEIIGGVTLSNVSLGPFRSANLGYWIDAAHMGQGLATAAVDLACQAADDHLRLHRVEAGTVLENAASQRVLAKSGFDLIGEASRYLHIDGEWRDHLLFQRILNDRHPA